LISSAGFTAAVRHAKVFEPKKQLSATDMLVLEEGVEPS
jgi:hypothetical protein